MKTMRENQWLFRGMGIQGVHTARQEARCRNGYSCCFGGLGRADC